MWKGNPALASVLFGLPFGFFALICYSICCADIMDAEEDDDEEEQTLAAASRDATGMWNKIFSIVKIWNVYDTGNTFTEKWSNQKYKAKKWYLVLFHLFIDTWHEKTD